MCMYVCVGVCVWGRCVCGYVCMCVCIHAHVYNIRAYTFSMFNAQN